MNAFLLAQAFQAKQLVLVTNTNGLYQDRNHPDSRIPTISTQDITDEYITRIC
jgi:acetylglutamate kinase